MHPPAKRTILVCMLALAARAQAGEQILLERFDTSVTGVFPPAGWSEIDVTGLGHPGWEPGANWSIHNLGGVDVAGHDILPGFGNYQESRLVSPTMDFTSVAAPRMNLHSAGMATYALATSDPQFADEHDVEVSIDGGATWTEVWTVVDPGPSSTGYEMRPATVDLASYAGAATVQVAFRYYGFESKWAIDNVVVVDAGTAGALYMVGNCGEPGSYVFADGVTPLGTVAFGFSFTEGGRIYQSPACPLLVSGLGAYPPHLAGVAQATSFGYAQLIPPNGIPAGACGGFLQAFDLTTCLPTPVLQL